MLHDLDSLRCFEAAARTLNFRAAAKSVALSPTAFSDRIRRLEEDLDAVLFHRTTRSVQLTRPGSRLLPEARTFLARADNLMQVIHSEKEVPFELQIGTRFELGLSWLLPALRALENESPHRTVHLSFGDSLDLLARTSAGLLDATITSARLSSARLDAAKLHEESYVFVSARPNKKSVRGRKEENLPVLLERAEDAQHFTLIDASPDLPLFRYFRDAPLEEKMASRASSFGRDDWRFGRNLFVGAIAGIRSLVLAGDGVAVLPRYLVQKDLQRGDLVALFPERPLLRDFFRLVFRSGHPQEVELRQLAQDLRKHPLQ
ncbi:MAG: LysR family transcriptional regulator [Deltaproteobacteria bacterium]|nr:LysR family transcriptional regulator [Deltaproteobacteria bacterium]